MMPDPIPHDRVGYVVRHPSGALRTCADALAWFGGEDRLIAHRDVRGLVTYAPDASPFLRWAARVAFGMRDGPTENENRAVRSLRNFPCKARPRLRLVRT